MSLEIAIGAALDRLVERFGLERMPGEPDSELRARAIMILRPHSTTQDDFVDAVEYMARHLASDRPHPQQSTAYERMSGESDASLRERIKNRQHTRASEAPPEHFNCRNTTEPDWEMVWCEEDGDLYPVIDVEHRVIQNEDVVPLLPGRQARETVSSSVPEERAAGEGHHQDEKREEDQGVQNS